MLTVFLLLKCVGDDQSDVKDSRNCILVHPNFRMIVLANRPGFPFLGNDFFASLGTCMCVCMCVQTLFPIIMCIPFATVGDIFSCHAVDNPDLESEKVSI